MECPACGNQLEGIEVGGVKVDFCRGHCGGIWFDQYELRKFDEPHESAGESLLEMERDENLVVDHERRRNCPRCTDMVMMRHFFSVKHQVEVDECAGCAGIWLDFGELGTIRSQFESDEERNRAADLYFSYCESELEAIRKKNADERVKTRRISNMLRFLSPSRYLAGNKK